MSRASVIILENELRKENAAIDPRLDVTEQLAFSTVRIECDTPEGLSTGTGFFYSFCQQGTKFLPALVSNKHVVDGATSGRFRVNICKDGAKLPNASKDFSIADFRDSWIDHPDPTVDLCVLPMTRIFNAIAQEGNRPFYISVDRKLLPSEKDLNDFVAVEEILMVGYPNGLWDDANNLPIFRRGITATHPSKDFQGRKEFLIDAACFPGSSGSPVFFLNTGPYSDRNGNRNLDRRVKFVGILYAGPVYAADGEIVFSSTPISSKPFVQTTVPINLGLVIKAEQLEVFEAILTSMLKMT